MHLPQGMAVPIDADTRRALPRLIRLWLGVTAALPMLLVLAGRIMHRRQAAAPERFRERLGHASQPRPSGHLIWVHAASVGEVTSIARLARQLVTPGHVTLLLTTTTATGAATAARALPAALHQFAPLDTPAAVSRFLAHWRPDAALFVEGDLWPRMIVTLAAGDCPMALVNARASRTRARFPAASAALLAPMRLITVQMPDLAQDLQALGLAHARIRAVGNLKADIDIPTVDEAARDAMTAAAQGRGIWAAVSTHRGEEALILDVHDGLAGRPLLVLVPRHPERGADLATELRKREVAFTQHSKGEMPGPQTQVHLVDALGITGTVFAATGLAFVGGSLVAGHGGHTPFEPAALGCAILSGPHVQNFSAAYATLQSAGAAHLVADSKALGDTLQSLLRDDATCGAMQQAARAAYMAQGGATQRVLDALREALPAGLVAALQAPDRNATP